MNKSQPQFTTQKLITLLQSRRFKDAKKYLEELKEGNPDAQDSIGQALRLLLVQQKSTPVGIATGLAFYKNLLLSSEIDFFDSQKFFDPLIHEAVEKVCRYRPKDNPEEKGKTYFIQKIKAARTDQSQSMGATFIILAMEIIQNMAKWYPKDYFDPTKPSRFANSHRKLLMEGVVFPNQSNNYIMKKEDKVTFQKNFAEWKKKAQEQDSDVQTRKPGVQKPSSQSKNPAANTINPAKASQIKKQQKPVEKQPQFILDQNELIQNKSVSYNKPSTIKSQIKPTIPQQKPKTMQSTLPATHTNQHINQHTNQHINKHSITEQRNLPSQQLNHQQANMHQFQHHNQNQQQTNEKNQQPQNQSQNKLSNRNSVTAITKEAKVGETHQQGLKSEQAPERNLGTDKKKEVVGSKIEKVDVSSVQNARRKEDEKVSFIVNDGKKNEDEKVSFILSDETQKNKSPQKQKEKERQNDKSKQKSKLEAGSGMKRSQKNNPNQDVLVIELLGKIEDLQKKNETLERALQHHSSANRPKQRQKSSQAQRLPTQSPKKMLKMEHPHGLSHQKLKTEQHHKKSLPKTERQPKQFLQTKQLSPVMYVNQGHSHQIFSKIPFDTSRNRPVDPKNKTLSYFRTQKYSNKIGGVSNRLQQFSRQYNFNILALISQMKLDHYQIPFLPQYFQPVKLQHKKLRESALHLAGSTESGSSEIFYQDLDVEVRLIKSSTRGVYILSFRNVGSRDVTVQYKVAESTRNSYAAFVKMMTRQTNKWEIERGKYLDINFWFRTVDLNFKFLELIFQINQKRVPLFMPITLLDQCEVHKRINPQKLTQYAQLNGKILKSQPFTLKSSALPQFITAYKPQSTSDRYQQLYGQFSIILKDKSIDHQEFNHLDIYLTNVNSKKNVCQVHAIIDSRNDRNEDFGKVMIELVIFLLSAVGRLET